MTGEVQVITVGTALAILVAILALVGLAVFLVAWPDPSDPDLGFLNKKPK